MKKKNFQKNIFVNYIKQAKGVALILVIFIIALATIIITQLTYSTMLTSQQNTNLQRATQGEYLLKSLESLAIILLNNDNNNYDSKFYDFTNMQDLQAVFNTPKDVSQFINIPIEGVTATMQLVPCNAYLNFTNLDRDIKKQQIIVSLFDYLDLENVLGEDTTTLLSNSDDSNAQLVTNIADYLDSNNDDCTTCLKQGIESKITDENLKTLWNGGIIYNLGTLYNIPKFNMNKVNALAPYICIHNSSTGQENNINLNYVSTEILQVLSDYIENYYPNSNFDVGEILTKQEDEEDPFTNQNISPFLQSIGMDTASFPNNFFVASSTYWELIASVSIGNSTSRIRSIIKKAPSGQTNSNQNSNNEQIIERELLF